jgi:hypothetical protein
MKSFVTKIWSKYVIDNQIALTFCIRYESKLNIIKETSKMWVKFKFYN